MKYEILPVIDVHDLEDALKLQFDMDFDNDIRLFLFYDNFMNDCYKSFSFKDLEEYKGFSWQDEEDISKKNAIKVFLKDLFPQYDSCIIDVSW